MEVVFVSRAPSPAASAVPGPARRSAAVSADGMPSAHGDDHANLIEETWLRIDEQAVAGGKEIEEDIVSELVRRHGAFIGSGE